MNNITIFSTNIIMTILFTIISIMYYSILIKISIKIYNIVIISFITYCLILSCILLINYYHIINENIPILIKEAQTLLYCVFLSLYLIVELLLLLAKVNTYYN